MDTSGFGNNVPTISVAGDWQVQIGAGVLAIGGRTLELEGPVMLPVNPASTVVAEDRYASLPLFDDTAAGWIKGVPLQGLATQETTAPGYLDPESVRVTPVAGGAAYVRDQDYAFDPLWATLGRLSGGRIEEQTPVDVQYTYGQGRLDAIVIDGDGRVSIRAGTPAVSLPRPPVVNDDEVLFATVWVPGRLERLTQDNLFPILEQNYPDAQAPSSDTEDVLANTLRKLRRGEALTILAWGDSVTDGGFLPSPDDRWQVQFVRRLRQRFPDADITLLSEAWGGRNTLTYINEPPGSLHNYRERVLAARPDLVISEFVNDAGLPIDETLARYEGFLADFQAIGAEWVILTPHYVIPFWMGLDREQRIDDDPRPYVAAIREFAATHPVALADAAARWGRLWRQGIPYTTLLSNMLNHPDPTGMTLFVDALMPLFPE